MNQNNKVYELRCNMDGSLLCKTKVNSIIESKCRKCKQLSYFISGTTYMEDKDNNFKGDK